MRLAAIGVLLLATTAGTAGAAARPRDFVKDPAAAYPHAHITGDVRIERGVEIGAGAVIVGGARPVYLLGRTRVGAGARVTQGGSLPLIAIHATIEGREPKLHGHGVFAGAHSVGAVSLAGGRVVRSSVKGLVAHLSRPIVDSLVNGYVEGAVRARSSIIGGIAKGELELDRAVILGIAHGPMEGAPFRLSSLVPPLQIAAAPGIHVGVADLGELKGVVANSAFQGMNAGGQLHNLGNINLGF